jgi:hypothetical protein
MPNTPEPVSNAPYVWTFGLGDRRVDIRRFQTSEGAVLDVQGGEAPGTTVFKDMAALVAYQSRLESQLIDGGWSLLAFSPERRSQADRRASQRDTLDRRRWWSDAGFRDRTK